MPTRFELKQTSDGQYFFTLHADNNETILSSEMYNAKAGAENGIASVKTNAAKDSRYDRRTSKAGKPYFVLKASNGEVIGVSAGYSSIKALENGIAAVRRGAPMALTGDMTGPSYKRGPKRWDVFICHTWEDKKSVAAPLAAALNRQDVAVWYDQTSLTLGDSLRRKIDEGLAASRYGIVILSPNFFAREWPQKELDALAAREYGGDKVILPIWHHVRREDVAIHSPMLADRVAVSSSRGLGHVVDEVLRVLRPPLETK